MYEQDYDVILTKKFDTQSISDFRKLSEPKKMNIKSKANSLIIFQIYPIFPIKKIKFQKKNSYQR